MTRNENKEEQISISDLLKKATAQANEKRYDEAISMLARAYEAMETTPATWPIETYFRLGRYLHLSGRFEESIEWLQKLHDTVDARADARELVYKAHGMRGRQGFLKIPKPLRNVERKIILSEIELYRKRQRTIEERQLKKQEALEAKTSKPTPGH